MAWPLRPFWREHPVLLGIAVGINLVLWVGLIAVHLTGWWAGRKDKR